MNTEKKLKVSPETIENFLAGTNPMQYVVGIEASYNEPFVHLIINDPQTGKRIEKHPYKPFLWYKEEIIKDLYGGKKMKAIEAAQKFGVKTKRLRVSDENGFIPDRLQNGYRYLVTCTKSYNNLVQFFKEGGLDIFSKEHSSKFFMFTPVEQFMIQTGIRLFKGLEDYNDLHRFQFDLETEGLDGTRHAIFQIGMKDNRGFEQVIEVRGDTAQERRDSEREMLILFFEVIDILRPDLISGYNSETFDWDFIIKRAMRLSIPIEVIAKCLDGKSKLKRKPAMLKLGNEQEPFEQTFMFGYNIIDIAHAVRRAQAINSDIKAWNLKYITKYSEVAKKNRVYIPGDKIHTIWSDKTTQYAFNDTNGDWYKISDKMPLNEGYKIVKGSYLIQRYLLDDLWETEQVDYIFNQAAFLISKILPTTYSRSTTMGTATQWKLIMAAWSYENDLAIPVTEKKREFTGGLSRLLEVGYAKNVVKLDYAALYPKNQLTHSIFPDLDISGVMEGILTYVVDTRDKFKFLTGKHKKIAKKLQERLDKEKDSLLPDELQKLEAELKENKALSNLYDKKQLPLKILANSWFGAYGAPYIFNWGDTDCAEETTCRGRQYLRLMVKHFCEKYGFKALVGDTDGFNFSFPDNINDIKYTAKGSHWKTEGNAGEELVGLDAVLAEFNENYMIGRMGLDIDDICDSTINFARKNYANSIGGKVKLVGNSIKSKKMPVYIEEFINAGIALLLDGKGKEFINLYYNQVDKIYNFNIPLVKIASKSKVKTSISDYKKRVLKKNKAGKPMPKQAHMELAIQANLDVNMGDTIYYVNTGSAKSHGDLKTIKKENGLTEIQINCKLIDSMVVESNLELIKEIETLRKVLIDTTDDDKKNEIESTIKEKELELLTDEYNVAKYLEAFNKKVKPLLVCFSPEIRDEILLTIKKDRKTKLENLTERKVFTEAQCQLSSGSPNKPVDQDTYEELMTMEDKEIKFWDKVNMVPNNMLEVEWETIRADYHERKRIERLEGIEHEKNYLDDIFKHFELEDLRKIETDNKVPDEILLIADLDDEYNFISRKWGTILCSFEDVFKYKTDAIKRNLWYQANGVDGEERYALYMEYLSEQEVMNVSVIVENVIEKEFTPDLPTIQKNAKQFEESPKFKKLKKAEQEEDEDSDDDDDDEYDPEALEPEVDGYIPELQKIDFEIELATAVTYEDVIPVPNVEQPNTFKDLLNDIKISSPEEKDEWNF